MEIHIKRRGGTIFICTNVLAYFKLTGKITLTIEDIEALQAFGHTIVDEDAIIAHLIMSN